MPDPATDTLRTALERLAATVDDANPARIRESWQSPGLVIQLACDEWDDIAAAVDAAREALAAAPAEPEWEWRAVLPAMRLPLLTFSTREQAESHIAGWGLEVRSWVERRRKADEWERVT